MTTSIERLYKEIFEPVPVYRSAEFTCIPAVTLKTKTESKTLSNQDILNSIKKVIFNNPATIVYWKDGTKTVVKANGEDFDKEKGLAMAIIKKLNDNKGNYNEIFHKWCE